MIDSASEGIMDKGTEQESNSPEVGFALDDSKESPNEMEAVAINIDALSLWYSGVQAIENVSLQIPDSQVTALIGPSGCGKSTLLRCINRMNELIPGVTLEGQIKIHGENIYEKDVDPVAVRRNVGMVVQKPRRYAW